MDKLMTFIISGNLTLFFAGLEIILLRAYKNNNSQRAHHLYNISFCVTLITLFCIRYIDIMGVLP